MPSRRTKNRVRSDENRRRSFRNVEPKEPNRTVRCAVISMWALTRLTSRTIRGDFKRTSVYGRVLEIIELEKGLLTVIQTRKLEHMLGNDGNRRYKLLQMKGKGVWKEK